MCIDQMTHLWLAGNVTVQALFQVAVRQGLPVVLAQMFSPGIHQEYFQIVIHRLNIAKDSPPIRSIATPYASILIDRFHELCFPFSNDRIFDRDQNRSFSLEEISPKVLDQDGHAPVVPWAQIRRRIRKSRDQREQGSADCSNPGIDQSNTDARALG